MADFTYVERALLAYGIRFPNHPRKWWFHSQLRRWLSIHPNREFDVVRDGLRWSLNPADFAHEALFWLGTKDTWDVNHLKRMAKPNDVILDVGANFGYYGLTLARILKCQCVVHALEPDPINLDRLRRHVEWNGLANAVRVHALSVSDHEGIVNLNRHPGNSGHSAIVPDGEVRGIGLTTLDRFCESIALEKLDMLILDVEGLEERALVGSEQTVHRLRPFIFVEFFPPVMSRQGSSAEAAAKVLRGWGYQLFVSRRDRLEPWTAMPKNENRENVFAFHSDKLPDSLRAEFASDGRSDGQR